MKKIVIWLCSSQDDELKELIADFSLELDSPVFLPHVTLLGSVEMGDTETYENAIRDIVKNWSPLKVTLDGIGYEASFWRCFYFKAFPLKDLSQFHIQLADKFSTFSAVISNDFMPHLSLIYAKMNLKQQRDFLEKHKDLLFSRTVIFDCIKIVHFVPEDVDSWEVLCTIPLKMEV